MNIQVCIGSSCHIKGSKEIIDKLQAAIKEHGYNDKIELSGSFCMGKCNPQGVCVKVDDEIYPGITPEHFEEFFKTKVIEVLEK